MLTQKVVKLNNSGVYDDISAFLSEIEMHSKLTKSSYESNIRQFFLEMRNKQVEHLSIEDLHFKRNDILNFRKIISEKFGYENGTVNQKIASIKSLFQNLKANDYELNIEIFSIKPLKNNPNSYGNLSQTEAERFAETALSTERELGKLKYLLIMFAIRTSFRLSEILNIKTNDFEYFEGVYKVTTIGKGEKKNTTAISKKLYDQLMELYNSYNNDDPRIFQISKKSVDGMMNRLREKLEIPKERNIVFHSLRKVAIDWEYETTGDLKKASIHAGHSSIETTFKHYLDKSVDYTQTPGVRMEEDVDWSFLEDVSTVDIKMFLIQSNYKIYLDLKNFLKNKE